MQNNKMHFIIWLTYYDYEALDVLCVLVLNLLLTCGVLGGSLSSLGGDHGDGP